MPCSSNSDGAKSIFDVKIHTVEVPLDGEIIEAAQIWLTKHLGHKAQMARPLKDFQSDTVGFDPTLIFTTEHKWDAYVDPSSLKSFFLIKDNSEIAMLFKLTFGGTGETIS